jgi:hypothetical protein
VLEPGISDLGAVRPVVPSIGALTGFACTSVAATS